jgi:hypothetical protein
LIARIIFGEQYRSLSFWHESFTFKFWHTLYVKCE